MKKNVIILAAAVTILSFAAGGCKSKEKISLDSIHTTESDSASMEKETMKESAAESTIETTSAQPSVSGTKETEGKTDSKDPASALSVRSKIATEKKGGISIEYPILSNLRDSSLTDKVNQLLKDNAVRIISGYDLDPDSDTLSIQCKILSLDRKKAVITYQGTLMVKDSAYPSDIFYTTTVDLNKGTLLGLSDYADAYTMAGYLRSDDVVIVKAAEAEAVKSYLKSQEIDVLWATLRKCDFTATDTGDFPQAFSYEDQGSICISYPLPHGLGDYVIVRFDPDTK